MKIKSTCEHTSCKENRKAVFDPPLSLVALVASLLFGHLL